MAAKGPANRWRTGLGAGNQIAIILGFKEAAQCFLIQYESFRFFGHGIPP